MPTEGGMRCSSLEGTNNMSSFLQGATRGIPLLHARILARDCLSLAQGSYLGGPPAAEADAGPAGAAGRAPAPSVPAGLHPGCRTDLTAMSMP